MLISYRRTGGLLALLTLAAVALAATVVTVAVAATLLIVALAIATAALLWRAVRLAFSRRRTVSPSPRWSEDAIETTLVTAAVKPRDSSDPSVSTTPDLVVQDNRKQ